MAAARRVTLTGMQSASEAAPPRGRRRIGSARVPLAALLGAVVILGVTWALLVPPWQSPDEPEHFAYAQSIATRLALPGAAHRLLFSLAQSTADNAVGAGREAFYPAAVPPSWSHGDAHAYARALAGHPSTSDGGGPNSAAANPPLFYLYSAAAYLAAAGGSNAFDQLYAMRVWNVLLLAATVTAAWLLAGEVFGRRRGPQLVCAAVSGLIPAETFVSTSVNPDALMVALWASALWLGTRVITRRGERRDMIALGLVTAAAVLTKATSYALVPPALLALALGWLRWPRGQRPRVVSFFAPPVLALVAPIIGWLALALALGRSAVNTIHGTPGPHPFRVKQFLDYLWQFYLPKLGFMSRFRETAQLPLYDVWIREGWGVFGWRDVAMVDWVYTVLTVVSAVVAVVAGAIVARLRGRLRASLLAFYGATVLVLLAGLHVTDYRAINAGQPAVLQGRYLLPVVPLFGLAVALIVTRLPARLRAPAQAVVVAGLLLLQVLALATVTKGYYT